MGGQERLVAEGAQQGREVVRARRDAPEEEGEGVPVLDEFVHVEGIGALVQALEDWSHDGFEGGRGGRVFEEGIEEHPGVRVVGAGS